MFYAVIFVEENSPKSFNNHIVFLKLVSVTTAQLFTVKANCSAIDFLPVKLNLVATESLMF